MLLFGNRHHGAFLVKEFKAGRRIFFLSSVLLFDLKVGFFVAIQASLMPSH